METALSNIGFAEFTTQLVVDVFDGLVTQNIRQMQAYMDLVESLAKTDGVYVEQNYDDVDSSLVDSLLARAVPDPSLSGSTLVSTGNALTGAHVEALNDAMELSVENGGLTKTISDDDPMAISGNEVTLKTAVADDATALTLTGDEVELIREAAARRIAYKQISSLREMAKMGLMRLVVDSGSIETRLTFSMTADSESTSTSSSVSIGSRSASATGRWMKVSASAATSRVRVSTASSFNQDTSGSSVQVFGSVKINFKTDYQPLSS